MSADLGNEVPNSLIFRWHSSALEPVDGTGHCWGHLCGFSRSVYQRMDDINEAEIHQTFLFKSSTTPYLHGFGHVFLGTTRYFFENVPFT